MFCSNCGNKIADGSIFCANCGVRLQSANLEAPMQTNANTNADAAPQLMGQIIGRKSNYYIPQFEKIKQTGKCSMNWASFWLGIFHAAYRNMWREWLRAIRLPLILSLAGGMLSGILLLIQPVLAMVFFAVAGVGGIWLLIAQILFAKKFNVAYKNHVEEKCARTDNRPDPSLLRGILVCAIAAGICMVIGFVFTVLVGASVLFLDEPEITEPRDAVMDDIVFQTEDEHVTSVKNGSPLSYPNKTYGESFENFFGSPEWEYFVGTKKGTDEDGDGVADSVEENVDVVQFTGYCTYQDVEVKALLQFTLSKEDDTFEATYLSFNEVPQSNFMLLALLETIFADEDMWDETENETVDYPALYQPVLAQVAQNPIGFQYCLYDLDQDGIMELIVETEEAAGGYMADIYTVENNELLHLGNEYIYYGDFYETEDGNGLYISYGHMGNEYVFRITKQGNFISVTEEWSIQTGVLADYYENDHPVLMYDVSQYDILQNPPAADTTPVTVEAYRDYACRMSSSKYLTDGDLAGLDAFGCKIARNEIYARYGRKFTDAQLQAYFDGKSWYVGWIEPDDFDDGVLNEYERANLEFIVQYESGMGYR